MFHIIYIIGLFNCSNIFVSDSGSFLFKYLTYWLYSWPFALLFLCDEINGIYSWVNKGSLEVTLHCQCGRSPYRIDHVFKESNPSLFAVGLIVPVPSMMPTHVRAVYDSLCTKSFCTQRLVVESANFPWGAIGGIRLCKHSLWEDDNGGATPDGTCPTLKATFLFFSKIIRATGVCT